MRRLRRSTHPRLPIRATGGGRLPDRAADAIWASRKRRSPHLHPEETRRWQWRDVADNHHPRPCSPPIAQKKIGQIEATRTPTDQYPIERNASTRRTREIMRIYFHFLLSIVLTTVCPTVKDGLTECIDIPYVESSVYLSII